jgi:hypothetical protein
VPLREAPKIRGQINVHNTKKKFTAFFEKKRIKRIKICSMRLPRTACEVGAHLPKVLASLATQYMTATRRTWKRIAMAGEYETCLNNLIVEQAGLCLRAACRAGHPHIVSAMIAAGVTYLEWGLRDACRGNQLALIQFMIAKGASDWDFALAGACRGGHTALVQIMMQRGAKAWNDGLEEACRGGHKDIVRLMIAKGAFVRWDPLRAACRGGHIDLVALMIEKGAKNWYEGFYEACCGGHANIARWMMALGNITHWDEARRAAKRKGHAEIVRLLAKK